MPTGAMQVRDAEPAVLERARAGDPGAFRAMVRHHDAGLRALAYGLVGDAARMDDVLQAAYVRAYRGLARCRDGPGVRTWIYRATYDACLDDLRRRSRPAGETGDVRVSAAGGAVGASALVAVLADLPADQRAAVLLVDAAGLDEATAGEVLGVSPGAVAVRLTRARTALELALGGGKDAR